MTTCIWNCSRLKWKVTTRYKAHLRLVAWDRCITTTIFPGVTTRETEALRQPCWLWKMASEQSHTAGQPSAQLVLLGLQQEPLGPVQGILLVQCWPVKENWFFYLLFNEIMRRSSGRGSVWKETRLNQKLFSLLLPSQALSQQALSLGEFLAPGPLRIQI